MKTVHEVAEQTGISVRTLHYYDEIGLLKPSKVTDALYRLYDDTAVKRLQQIMFYRELGFALKDIRAILGSRSFDEREALKKHKKLLLLKRERLDALIGLVERTLKGEDHMSFREFDETQIAKTREAYAREARERWGATQAYAQSEQKTARYDREKWKEIDAATQQIYRKFAAHIKDDPESGELRGLVREWQEHITKYFYTCTNEILAGLGEMYVGDERFKDHLNAYAPGLAKCMSEAIRAYCAK